MKKKNKTASELEKQIITGNIEISPGVHLITFKRPWGFIPGQVIKVALSDSEIPRIYSLCSGSSDNEAASVFNIKTDGELTPKMAKSKRGDTVFISAPYGSFTGSDSPAWWIATGTGIAPFYSMLRSGFNKNKKLIHGVSFLNQFYFKDYLENELGENYIMCCSREISKNTFSGRVTDYISSLKNLPDVEYLLCGSALMVVEMRDLLISKGIGFEKISAEIYF